MRRPGARLAAAPVLTAGGRAYVLGGGKAGAAMAAGVEAALAADRERVEGVVNVPAGEDRQLRRIRLWPARPAAQPPHRGGRGRRRGPTRPCGEGEGW